MGQLIQKVLTTGRSNEDVAKRCGEILDLMLLIIGENPITRTGSETEDVATGSTKDSVRRYKERS